MGHFKLERGKIGKTSRVTSSFPSHCTAESALEMKSNYCLVWFQNVSYISAVLIGCLISLLSVSPPQAGGSSARLSSKAGSQPHTWTPRMEPETIRIWPPPGPEKVCAQKHYYSHKTQTHIKVAAADLLWEKCLQGRRRDFSTVMFFVCLFSTYKSETEKKKCS